MQHSSWSHRFLSILCILGLLTPGLTVGATADARITGRVLGPAGDDPVAGVVVQATRVGAEEPAIQAGPTDSKGLFAIARMPAGTYELAFQTDGETWSGSRAIQLATGETRAVLVTLAPAVTDDENDDEDEGEEETEGDPDDPNIENQPPPKPAVVGKKASRFRNPLIATLTLITFGGLVGAALDEEDDEDDDDASPSNPE
jgi:hypothetical protein